MKNSDPACNLERLQDYFDGQLSDIEAAAVRTHVEKCAPCREALQGWGALRGLVAASVAVPAGQADALQWVRLQSALRAPRRHSFHLWDQLLPAAAALAFAALLLQLLRTPATGTGNGWDYLSFQSADARSEWAAQVAPHPAEQIDAAASVSAEGM